MLKTFTFAIMHFSVAFGVVWAMTGSWVVGGAVALVEPAINTVAFFFHEKAWERFAPGVTRVTEHSPGTALV